ncbi:hypothetical protein RIF29_15005 [Crotalaria pallida]|uniref:Uncharacterized protein n=1 Tax=Crotalaria pallida TaxID=3830 RepID=A0AAN9IC83_CROPI
MVTRRDSKLKEHIEKHGTGGDWITLPQKAGLNRCGKSCRLRWLNYLWPNIKHGEFSDEEDRIICTLYANIGSSRCREPEAERSTSWRWRLDVVREMEGEDR